MSLTAEGIALSLGRRQILSDVSLRVVPGRIHALLGANGAGKTCLLRVLAGELRPDRGTVRIDGVPPGELGAMELARRRAVLPQHDALSFGFPVRDVVRLGRHPWPEAAAHDHRQAVADAMQATETESLAERPYTQLSGGERQRVQLARVLAQLAGDGKRRGHYLLLDEPTAHLDLRHQHASLRQARRLAADGVGVLAVLHDPNLAARYADDVTLLQRGRTLCSGPRGEVLDAARLSQTYGTAIRTLNLDGRLRFEVDQADGGP